MKLSFLYLSILLFLTSCGHTYYVVRHAEKATQSANMSSDVSLNEKGKQRAETLKELLGNKKIAHIYSTPTIRTMSTAQPTADHFKLAIEKYGPVPDSIFISKLKTLQKNTLVVGHSNTVDNLVNGLAGNKVVPGDLHDSVYNKLFVIKVKGKKSTVNIKTYGN
ncbi:MAG: histidine phosphatase family protein [Chitinophagaceae bacterium]|nr:histidine phosphatase family protein [Chitinophagaceae bacterium]